MAKKNSPSKEAVKSLQDFLQSKSYDFQCEISLCLSDLPKSHMSKAKNGKVYADIVVGIRKEPDQWGRDLKVYMKPTKEDRENKSPKSYVGGGKMIIFEADGITPPEASDYNNLPWNNEDIKEDDF